jgi:hypothetical protein
MHARRLLPLALLLLAGCSRKGADTPDLVPEVRRRLAERDTRLTSYRFEGTLQDAGAPAVRLAFAYRAPQRMQGALVEPVARAFSWDGQHLYERHDGEKRFTTFKNELPPERRAGYLTELFAPFTPEGFRAPLLPRAGVSARRAPHPRAPEAVELTVRLEDAGGPLELTYVLRWPGLDFLGKRTRAPDGTLAEVRVEEEHCDEALKLCVPRRLTRWVADKQTGESSLSRVELNPALPNDFFTLAAPEGYTAETKTLVVANTP